MGEFLEGETSEIETPLWELFIFGIFKFAPGGVNEVDDKGRDGEDEDQANLKKNTFVIPRIFLVPWSITFKYLLVTSKIFLITPTKYFLESLKSCLKVS